LIGNSGNTSESHLHIHVQSVIGFFDPNAVGLRLVFTDYLPDAEPFAIGAPVQGQFIEQEPLP